MLTKITPPNLAKANALRELIEEQQKRLRERVAIAGIAKCSLCGVPHPVDSLDEWLCCPTCIERENRCQR